MFTTGERCGVMQILGQIEAGDSSAVNRLMPLVYDELRKLAALVGMWRWIIVSNMHDRS